MRALPDLSVYLVLDSALCAPRGMIATAVAAVAGGVRVVQLRHKTAATPQMVVIGRTLMAALDGSGTTVIVNDDVEAAQAIGAHGVHVGQSDMAAANARAQLGPAVLLGVSVETDAAARAIDPAVVDYVGAGPVFATPTKPDHDPAVGFDGLARLVAAAPVPAVAIGGLKIRHAAEVHAAGASGMAVVSAICGQPDPHTAARALRVAWDAAARGTGP
jgi:thiamine-phosphate pyrophosphorylase